VAGPTIGINVPTLYFLPTAYTIAIAFLLDPARDRVRAFSFAVFVGFLYLLLITGVAPLVFQWLNPGNG
jgi:hypothetical protein